eukprot:m.22638 g.22638  ORF g.22638 m.22638 type:complete len:275 (+) comp8872_c0_seq1:116-940(+)
MSDLEDWENELSEGEDGDDGEQEKSNNDIDTNNNNNGGVEEEEDDDIIIDDTPKESLQQSKVPKKYLGMNTEQLLDAIVELEKALRSGAKASKKDAEEERKRHEEELARLEASAPELTEAERNASKLALKREIEEREEEDVRRNFGEGDISFQIPIESMQPATKKDFESFENSISRKVKRYDHSPHYQNFLVDLFKNLCGEMDSSDIRGVTKKLDILSNEKSKEEKAKRRGGKSKKKKEKPSLRGGTKAGRNALAGFVEDETPVNEDMDDYDFM